MAGLSDALTSTETIETTLPSWYTTAQQNIVNDLNTAVTPSFETTTGGAQAKKAFDASQPFAQAQSTLNAIATGAADPWNITTDATGAQVATPDISTPLGGLFQAQTNYLTSMMPEISAKQTGAGIGSGGFGSSMNQAAVSRARGQAINQLLQQQNLAALQAQQTGVSAASALGNLGSSQLQGALNLATAEQNAPYAEAINQANILSKMAQPRTQTTSTELGALQQLGALLNLGQGATSALFGTTQVGADGKPVYTPGILDKVFGTGTAKEWQKSLKDIFSLKPGVSATGSTIMQLPAVTDPNDPAYGWTYYSNGTAVDPNGNYYQNGELVSSGWTKDPTTGLFVQQEDVNSGGGGETDTGGGAIDTGGGAIDTGGGAIDTGGGGGGLDAIGGGDEDISLDQPYQDTDNIIIN